MDVIATEPVVTQANLLLRLGFGLPVIAVMFYFVLQFRRGRTVYVPVEEGDEDLDTKAGDDKPAGSPSTSSEGRPSAPDA